MKRVLKVLGIGLVVVAVLYGAAIALTPPTRYETRIEVGRQVARVWEVFVDESRAHEWLQGLVSMRLLSGERHAVGSTYELVFEEGDKRLVLEEEVTSFVPEEEFGMRLRHAVMDSESIVRFEDLGDGRTAITTENGAHGHGLWKPIVPFMKQRMVERQQEGYARLAALIEAE